MIARAFSRTAVAAAVALACTSTVPAWGFLGLFKKATVNKAPSGTELQSQEAAAGALVSQGQTTGKTSLYDEVIRNYPFTKAAGEAAYLKALSVRQKGKLKDAFNAFQDLIEKFHSSPRFADAVQQQYEIAEEAKGGKKQMSMIMVPMKLGPSETIDLYKKVIANAPFGKFAPLAQFSIAEIHQDQGEKNEAVAAYQMVVDNYPTSKQCSEAQFRIGAISNIAAKRTEDTQNLTASRDALKAYVTTNPGGDRLGEAKTLLNQIDSEEAARSLSVGKFYEKSGKPKAAAIYYNEAIKFGNPEVSAEARERLAAVSAQAPAEVASAKKSNPSNDYTVPAAADLRSRADYAGPPSPDLNKLSAKPKMRKEESAGFSPIPVQEPTLPTKPDATSQPAAGSLLPPVVGDKPALLPVPPPPAEGAAPVVPPPPAAEKKP